MGTTSLRERVGKAVGSAPIFDLHTHLFSPEFGELNLWGIDELLTYHYLIAEVLRAVPNVTPEQFFAASLPERAQLVWDGLFVKRTPVSEATSGIVSILTSFGFDPRRDSLAEIRRFYSSRPASVHLESVLETSGVRQLVMTNDPFDPAEWPKWESGVRPDPRFLAALRLDPLLNHWPAAASAVGAGIALDEADLSAIRRFLEKMVGVMSPRYVAVSLPDAWRHPSDDARARILTQAVLPVCAQHNLPFAIMLGVRRAVNPRMGLAGDGVGLADVASLERLAQEFPANRFLVTTLSRENAQALCVAGRKFSNLLVFGCWWFMNNPSLVLQTTLLRLEMLGMTFVPQHSDARVLCQLPYKWENTRRAVTEALTIRYSALAESGYMVSDEEVERDAKTLMGGLAAEWLGVEGWGGG